MKLEILKISPYFKCFDHGYEYTAYGDDDDYIRVLAAIVLYFTANLFLRIDDCVILKKG